jgi:site-specific DNA-methyltransferase (adenine-specific)
VTLLEASKRHDVSGPSDAPRRRSKRKKGSEVRDAWVQVRVESAERETWKTCADAEGYLGVSDWLRDVANNRARSRPTLASGATDWNTPPEVLRYVRQLFGKRIGFDPCSNATSIVEARHTWDVTTNGLDRSWIGKGSGYVNPPYGDELPQWIAKCRLEAAEGVELLALVPARTDTKWWRQVITSPATIGLWSGRIHFLGAPNPAPFPSVMIYWGPRPDEFVDAFGEVCSNGFLRGT